MASTESRIRPTCSGYTAGLLGAIVRRRRRRHMRQTVGVADAFPIVIIGVSLVAIVVAVVVSLARGGLQDRSGAGMFSRDREQESSRGPAPDTPQARAEAAEEIRQL